MTTNTTTAEDRLAKLDTPSVLPSSAFTSRMRHHHPYAWIHLRKLEDERKST